MLFQTPKLRPCSSISQVAIGTKRGDPCKPAAGWSDGRRQFGTVRDAIVEVLSRADSELRVKDIQAGVEALLNSPVSRSSVKSYLHKGCRRRIPLFENLGWGRYRLLG